MVIGLLTIELYIPHARSLKDKRMVLRSVVDRVRKFNVAITEIDFHDLWQRAALGAVTISTDQQHADQSLAAVVAEIERAAPGMIARHAIEFL